MASVAQHAVVIVHSHFHDNLLRNKNFVELMASIYGIFGCEKRHSEFDRFGLIFIFHFGHSVAVIFLFSVFFSGPWECVVIRRMCVTFAFN